MCETLVECHHARHGGSIGSPESRSHRSLRNKIPALARLRADFALPTCSQDGWSRATRSPLGFPWRAEVRRRLRQKERIADLTSRFAHQLSHGVFEMAARVREAQIAAFI